VQWLQARRLFYRGIRFHRMVRCGESAVLDREEAFAPLAALDGRTPDRNDPSAVLIRSGHRQVTFFENFGAETFFT
jgi:hypothetical protein